MGTLKKHLLRFFFAEPVADKGVTISQADHAGHEVWKKKK